MSKISPQTIEEIAAQYPTFLAAEQGKFMEPSPLQIIDSDPAWKVWDAYFSLYFTDFCQRHELEITERTKRMQANTERSSPLQFNAYDPISGSYFSIQFRDYGKAQEHRIELGPTEFEVPHVQQLCNILEMEHIVLSGNHFLRYDGSIANICKKIKKGIIDTVTLPCADYNTEQIEKACAIMRVFLEVERYRVEKAYNINNREYKRELK